MPKVPGCIEGHSALIFDRGGSRQVGELVNLSKVEWGRVEGAKSLSTVTISAKNCASQMRRIEGLIPRRHEMVIFRGDQRVWEGPLLDLGWFSDRLEVYSTDAKAYLDARPLTKPWPLDTGTPVGDDSALMTERIKTIIEYELGTDYTIATNGGAVVVPAWENLDPAINVLPHLDVRPSTTLLTRSATTAYQMSVGRHLDNLSDGRLSYTFIGRMLLIWDSAQSIGRTRVLTEADFYGELKVYDSGSDFISLAHLASTTTDDEEEPGVGHAGAADPVYGPWALTDSLEQEEGDEDEVVQTELNSQAQRRLVGKNPVPTQLVVPDGGGIRLNETLTINHLIPGAVMPVRATMNLKKVQQDQRLTSMTVTEDANGEQVSVSLTPAGELLEVA